MTEIEIDEKAVELASTYKILCEFCADMEFDGGSVSSAMVIMLFQLASARGIPHADALAEIKSIWDKIILADLSPDSEGRLLH